MTLSKADILQAIADAGGYKAGVARVTEVSAEAVARYRHWIDSGHHAGMDYMTRYDDVRRDPGLLLEGARSIISVAFNYYSAPQRTEDALEVAMYALGDDYHEVVRKRLGTVATLITDTTGAACRVCVDTAPLRERYWAVEAGLGFIGRNNMLIIPGAGSYFFLGEIITTLQIEPDRPMTGVGCGTCRQCVDVCPGKAIDGCGAVDARVCHSYLTIEHRGALPDSLRLSRRVYGCDECQRVCPFNRLAIAGNIPEFSPRRSLLSITREQILSMTPSEFSEIARHSAIKRTRLDGLQRNARHIGSSHSTQACRATIIQPVNMCDKIGR